MARTKAVVGTGARFSDYLSARLLARVYPAAMIGEILHAHSCHSKRIRSLSAGAGTYFGMALSLYPEAAYAHVFAVVSQGFSWMQGKEVSVTIAKSSLSDMRGKIGDAPLQTLMARACIPLADATHHPAACYAGLRLVAIDGSNLEVADEPDNLSALGYPGRRTGHAGYPQAQCAVLVECGSHAIINANLGAYRESEWTICTPLLASLDDRMLCLADRGVNGDTHWAAAQAPGAQLLWRCARNRTLPVVKALSDGSYSQRAVSGWHNLQEATTGFP